MKKAEHLSKKDLLSCIELGKAIVSDLDSGRLFDIILGRLTELIPADNWSLMLIDHETGELCFNLCAGINTEELKNTRLKPGEGIAGRVALEQKPVIIEDVAACGFFSNRIDVISGFRTSSVICVPLIMRGVTVGVLEAINPSSLAGRVILLLKHIADYTAIAVENMRLFHSLEVLVDHDNLTGFYNTRFMYRDLTERIEICRKGNGNFSLIFMDIDNFKKVVEQYGHINASRAIRDVAAAVADMLMPREYCVSYAGDEFVIVIPDAGGDKAMARADEMRQRLSEKSFIVKTGVSIKLSASFGIATFPHDGDTLATLLSRADIAMFNAKDAGKNSVKSC